MTQPLLEWLPEHHLETVATLAHADELIDQVGTLQHQFLNQAGGVINLEGVSGGLVSRTRVAHIAPIPSKYSRLVADIFVALRTAVEHTLFAEAEFLNGGPLEEKAARSVEMPACLTREVFDEWLKNSKRPASLRQGAELTRRVGALQPFHLRSRPDSHPLARLVLHTNNTKHRRSAATAVRLVTILRGDEPVRSTHDLRIRDERPLQVGEVLAELPHGVQIQAELFPSIVVNRPHTKEWPIAITELGEISDWVRTQAIPILITGDAQSDAELPPHYDINVGHDDVRAAISLGTSVPANHRIRTRMGARSGRESLAELMQYEPYRVDSNLVTRWLSSLNDEDVIERMHRLKQASISAENSAQATSAVIHGLRGEVMALAGVTPDTRRNDDPQDLV